MGFERKYNVARPMEYVFILILLMYKLFEKSKYFNLCIESHIVTSLVSYTLYGRKQFLFCIKKAFFFNKYESMYISC